MNTIILIQLEWYYGMFKDYLIKLDEDICQFNVWLPHRKLHIGYLNYWNKEQYIEIADVRLKPDYRQQGIGSELIKRVIILANDKNYSRIQLETSSTDFPVHRFYKKHGFKLVESKESSAYFVLNMESIR